jgi:hypothetical protein
MKRLMLFPLLVLSLAVPAQSGLPRRVIRTDKIAPDVPTSAPDPGFPLRVHLLVAKWGGVAGVYHGYGSGNLLDARGVQGFDYAFECREPFVNNETPDETYQARWRRPNSELELLMSEAGTPNLDTCTLLLALKERPFEPGDMAKMTHGLSSSLRVPWRDPGFAYEPAAPDYPVHFHVLDGARTEDNSADHGWGTANLADPAVPTGLQGAEYTYDCWRGFLTNSQLSGFYQGHWVKPGAELEVLLQRAGSDKVEKCKVRVNLQPQPYPERAGIRQPPQSPPAQQPPAPIVRMPPSNP